MLRWVSYLSLGALLYLALYLYFLGPKYTLDGPPVDMEDIP